MKLFKHGQDAQMELDEVFQFWNFHIEDARPGLPYPIADHHRERPREEAEGVFLSIAPLITIILNQFNSKTHT